jgi:hypothetical protein
MLYSHEKISEIFCRVLHCLTAFTDAYRLAKTVVIITIYEKILENWTIPFRLGRDHLGLRLTV